VPLRGCFRVRHPPEPPLLLFVYHPARFIPCSVLPIVRRHNPNRQQGRPGRRGNWRRTRWWLRCRTTVRWIPLLRWWRRPPTQLLQWGKFLFSCCAPFFTLSSWWGNGWGGTVEVGRVKLPCCHHDDARNPALTEQRVNASNLRWTNRHEGSTSFSWVVCPPGYWGQPTSARHAARSRRSPRPRGRQRPFQDRCT